MGRRSICLAKDGQSAESVLGFDCVHMSADKEQAPATLSEFRVMAKVKTPALIPPANTFTSG